MTRLVIFFVPSTRGKRTRGALLGFELCSSVEAEAAPIEDPISPVTAVAFKLQGMIC